MLLVPIIVSGASGCSSLGYYAQQFSGQMEILSNRRPIAQVVSDTAVPAAVRQRLTLIQWMRRFAVDDLGLPDNGSYTTYRDIERPFVIFNVFATPELSLEPVQSCFPLVGCLDYRGFFREYRARRYAETLKRLGYDVYVGGVAAYSTLGWFDDPVINTMIGWSEPQMARHLFHELAHQKLYVTNDTPFNEAFAEAVADIGVERWYRKNGNPTGRDEYRRLVREESAFIHQVLELRRNLLEIFSANGLSTW